MRISDWSSDVCSSDLALPIVTAPAYVFLLLQDGPDFAAHAALGSLAAVGAVLLFLVTVIALLRRFPMAVALPCGLLARSEEHTSELQSLMRIAYAVS